MDVHVRIRYGCSKQHVEEFASNRFLIHVISKEDEDDAQDEVIALLAKHAHSSPDRIELRRDNGKDKVYFLS